MFVTLPVEAIANELEGKVTSLSSDEKAPYAGVLLDPVAAARMLVDQKYLRFEIELQIRKEFQQDLSNKRLAYDLLKVEYDSLKKIHEDTLALRERQINDLNVLLRVFYASVEIAK